MNAVASWLSSNRDVYFGNATATRDYRVQLRGGRAPVLFGVYLSVLIVVAYFVYSGATRESEMSIVAAQEQLHQFYLIIMLILAAAICLVAPGLSATTIAVERQRRSLDLVFSAPVSPKYYLVGKMLSSYRFIWMLLVLSLPVTASCIVLGGASWSDVLGAYVLLSTQALNLIAIALLLSTVSPRPVAAVIWSYGACIPFLMLTGSLAASFAFRSTFMHGSTSEVPFVVALNPFAVTYAVGTHTTIGGVAIPNWVFSVLFTALFSKLCLLCSGALLSPDAGPDARSLRVQSFLYLLAVAGWIGYDIGCTASASVFSVATGPLAGSAPLSGTSVNGYRLGALLACLLMPLVLFVGSITCYGFFGPRRHLPDGWWTWRGIFRPTPASGLPFLWTLILGASIATVAGYAFGARSVSASSLLPDEKFLIFPVLSLALWSFIWACGRLTSAWARSVSEARTMQFVIFIVIAVLPYPVFMLLDPDGRESLSGMWTLWILRPLAGEPTTSTTPTWVAIALMSAFAFGIAVWSERLLTQRTQAMEEAVAKRDHAKAA